MIETQEVDLSTILPWADRKILKTTYGERVLRAAPLTADFQMLFRLNQPELTKLGISIQGKEVHWWRDRAEDLAEREWSLAISIQTNPLYDYQGVHAHKVAQALRDFGAALDPSDTGTGKTPVSCVVLRELKLRPIVICKKSGVGVWKRWLSQLGIEPLWIGNYERARLGQCPYLTSKPSAYARKKARQLRAEDCSMVYMTEIAPGKTPSLEDPEFVAYVERQREIILNSDKEFTFCPPAGSVLIFDEVHKCTNKGTQNSEILVAAKKSGVPLLLLSATLLDSPLRMYAIGFALGLHQRTDFSHFLYRIGCRKEEDGYGWEWTGEQMVALNKMIFPWRGARMRKSEIPGFPKVQIVTEPYDFDKDTDRARRVWEEHRDRLFELQKLKAEAINEAVELGYARQEAELIKVNFFVDEATELIGEGHSVVIGVNFDHTRKTLMERFNTESAVYGGQSGRERDEVIRRFQADEQRKIIVNLQAGSDSISLNDVLGKHPRVGLLSPTFSAVDLVQFFGRLNRADDKSKALYRLIYVPGTPEEAACYAVQKKINNIALLNDADLMAGIRLFLRRE